MFDLILVADWSAKASPSPLQASADAIWVCADLNGSETVEYFRTRSEAMLWIEDWLSKGHRTLLGFDFAFGYPHGFAARLTGEQRALAVWDWLAERITDGPKNANNRYAVAEEINRAFPGTGPLWGRPASYTHPDLPMYGQLRTPDHGVPENRTVDRTAKGTQSVLKLAGAGSVGGQTLVGLAALAGLRHRHDLRVWPMETGFAVPESGNLLVEIFPSLFWTRPSKVSMPEDMIADREQVLATARALRVASPEWFSGPGMLPDAARIATEEGWILGLSPGGDVMEPIRTPSEEPSSCFALPPGVHWTPVDQALETLRQACPAVTGLQDVPIGAATDRILAADITATRSNPPAANAAVDGWAFAHATLGTGPIPVQTGRSAAGQPFVGAVMPGHVLRILTGAEIPAGADTVALQEDAMVEGHHLKLKAIPKAGANTRKAGEDVAAGTTVLAQGTQLRPTDIAFAIAAGHGTLPVRARLRVGVLSTGDEITAPGSLHGIPDVNRPMLLALLENWGMTAVDLGHAPDDADRLAAMLDGARTDAILTSGGASAGDEDHLSRLLQTRGGVHHWRIAVKPGRPLALGHWNGTPLFGLPGNPVAAVTCAALFARPALRQMAGAGWHLPVGLTVPAHFTKNKKAGRTEILRARLRGGRAEIFRSEGSGLVSGLSWAEGFVELGDGAAQIEPGTPVRYIPFSEIGLG